MLSKRVRDAYSGREGASRGPGSGCRIYISNASLQVGLNRKAWPNIFAHNWPELIQVFNLELRDDCSPILENLCQDSLFLITSKNLSGDSRFSQSRWIKIGPDNCLKSFRIDCKHSMLSIAEQCSRSREKFVVSSASYLSMGISISGCYDPST